MERIYKIIGLGLAGAGLIYSGYAYSRAEVKDSPEEYRGIYNIVDEWDAKAEGILEKITREQEF